MHHYTFEKAHLIPLTLQKKWCAYLSALQNVAGNNSAAPVEITVSWSTFIYTRIWRVFRGSRQPWPPPLREKEDFRLEELEHRNSLEYWRGPRNTLQILTGLSHFRVVSAQIWMQSTNDNSRLPNDEITLLFRFVIFLEQCFFSRFQ